MRRIALAVVIGVVATAGSPVSAHHSYAAYDTEHRVTIEGDLEGIQMANPHVILRLRTADSTVYTVVWQGITWVYREAGWTKDTFKVGDHLVIKGAPARDVTKHELATLRAILRTSDGWSWGESQARDLSR